MCTLGSWFLGTHLISLLLGTTHLPKNNLASHKTSPLERIKLAFHSSDQLNPTPYPNWKTLIVVVDYRLFSEYWKS